MTDLIDVTIKLHAKYSDIITVSILLANSDFRNCHKYLLVNGLILPKHEYVMIYVELIKLKLNIYPL